MFISKSLHLSMIIATIKIIIMIIIIIIIVIKIMIIIITAIIVVLKHLISDDLILKYNCKSL